MIFTAIADWADSGDYPVAFMCAEVGVSRSGYYAWRKAVRSAHETHDEALIVVLPYLHAEALGNPGVRRLRAGLAAAGYRVGRKRVHRLMRLAGLRGRAPEGVETHHDPRRPAGQRTGPDRMLVHPPTS
ncbi:MAG: putative transposase [Mycobacterium sp.]|nr:putative transposase [Mycobacterium sp.]